MKILEPNSNENNQMNNEIKIVTCLVISHDTLFTIMKLVSLIYKNKEKV